MHKPLSKNRYQSSHSVDYGFKISAQDLISTDVVSVVCQFCIVFASNKNVDGKSSRSQNVKYVSTFWTDEYKLHISTAHAEKWEEYQNMKDIKDKEEFFAIAPIVFGNTLHAHLESASHLRVLISATILKT